MFANLIQDTLSYLHSGGLIMIPLILVSICMWTLILKKLVIFSKIFQAESSFKDCMEAHKRESTVGAPWQQCLVSLFFEKRTGDIAFDRTLAASLASTLAERARRYITTIIVLAAAAPLLGLLGTVTGMISTFDVMAQYGTGNAKAMASGISEALITTQAGLFIAVPGLFMGNFLRRRAENLNDKMQRFAMRLVGE